VSSALDIRFTHNWEKKKLGNLGKLYCGQSPSFKDVNIFGIGTVYVTGPGSKDEGSHDPINYFPFEGLIFILHPLYLYH